MLKALRNRDLRTPLGYIVAIASVGVLTLLMQRLQISGDVVWMVFLVAALSSGVVGGFWPTLVAAGLAALSVDYFFLPAVSALKIPSSSHDVAALLIFGCASALAAYVSQAGRRARLEQTRADAAAGQLTTAARRRALLLELGVRSVAGGSVEAIGRDATAMTIDALGVEHCAVYQLSRNGEVLALVSGAGWEAGQVEGLTISADVDTQAGYALHAREPVVVIDAVSDTRFSLPAMLRMQGVRSGLAARIMGAGRPVGVVAAYSTSPRIYGADEAHFMSGVAVVLSGIHERRRLETERAELATRDTAHRSAAELASRRALFLAQTATVFDAALEPEAMLVSLARLAVPALADCAIVDLVEEDGRVRRVEVVDIDPTRREVTQAVRRQAPNLQGDSPFSRTIRTGQPMLLSEVPDRRLEQGADPEQTSVMKVLQSQSLLLVPLVARGQTLGLLTLASRDPVRRYETADLAVAQELAGRAAIALDNARLYRESQMASRTKDEFLATVSHELRAPINAVLGWTAVLRQHRLDATRADHACDAIERSARAQAQLLGELLDVSRAIAGKLELHLAPAKLGDIIKAAIDAVRSDADDKSVRIVSRLDTTIPLIMADPERLSQVVINLVSNAVKFSPDDGIVHVELRRDEAFAEIAVQDRGIGIKREFLPYVFDRFRQAEVNRGQANHGLGLGLSIARDIVEGHGGTIAADSAGEGQGAAFTVRLPLRSTAETAVLSSRVSTADVGK